LTTTKRPVLLAVEAGLATGVCIQAALAAEYPKCC
jgi:hypothetical protein